MPTRRLLPLAASLAVAAPLAATGIPTPARGAPPIPGAPCTNGTVSTGGFTFACSNVDLLSILPFTGIPTFGNDVWGWTDPVTGHEIAIVGLFDGVAFADISDPEHPVHLGTLPTATQGAFWADVKVYRDHAYIVKDNAGDHGLQIFDLRQLRDVTSPPQTFTATAHYLGIGNAHNLAIDEETGFAYVVGATSTTLPGAINCGGGLHMLDLSEPEAPAFVGCFAEGGYTHDVQCVVYRGPDTDHQGRQLCFAATPANTLTVVDVTDKSAPVLLSRTPYEGAAYAHQGWLTEDHAFFLFGDEDDELSFGHGTRTYVFDVRDLDAPIVTGSYTSDLLASDHNLFVRGDLLYEANYASGLRILRIGDLETAQLTEVAYFDTYPPSDDAGTSVGPWSVYPFFDSGVVVVGDVLFGLFLLRPTKVTGFVIDIRPGSAPNTVNPYGRSRIPVALLGSDTLDVGDVDAASLRFGPAGAAPAHDLTDPLVRAQHTEDVNGDGLADLLAHYPTQQTGIASGDTAACLSGATEAGVAFEACDAVSTQTSRCGLGFEPAFALGVLAWRRRRRRPS